MPLKSDLPDHHRWELEMKVLGGGEDRAHFMKVGISEHWGAWNAY